MTVVSTARRRAAEGFRHEAVIYHGLSGLVDMVLPFVREGIERHEPVMVATLPDRIEALEAALGADAARVSFTNMLEIGRNPACIIPVWRDFRAEHAGEVSVRGVGEPVWAGRRAAELDECRLHEALLNVAFDDGPRWRLMCPYDADGLPVEVLSDVMRTHPSVAPELFPQNYSGHAQALEDFTAPLPPPPRTATVIDFRLGDLHAVRTTLYRMCEERGLAHATSDDLVLAAHEVATNSIKHGGGHGILRAWCDPDALVVEVRDSGVISNPMVGRDLESEFSESGRGLWMANQLCDLVQVRSAGRGTTVRLYAWL